MRHGFLQDGDDATVSDAVASALALAILVEQRQVPPPASAVFVACNAFGPCVQDGGRLSAEQLCRAQWLSAMATENGMVRATM